MGEGEGKESDEIMMRRKCGDDGRRDNAFIYARQCHRRWLLWPCYSATAGYIAEFEPQARHTVRGSASSNLPSDCTRPKGQRRITH